MTTLTQRPSLGSGDESTSRAWLDRPLPARALALVRLSACGALTVTIAVRALPTVRLAEAGVGWDPVGVLAPLDTPPSALAGRALLVSAIALGIAAIAGWRWRVTGPAFAVAALGATTLATSWGHLFHADNLMLLHVVVIALSPAADAWSLDARRRDRERPGSSVRYGFPIRLAAMATATTYVLAGWAKLRLGGLDWIDGDTLQRLVAHDNLRKELIGAPSTPLAGPVVRQAWMFGPMALITMLVELGAPVALLGKRWAASWCTSAWLFHLGIAAVMTVTFWYPLAALAFLPTLLAADAVPRRLAARLR